MRCSVTKFARYCHQGSTVSAGREILSMTSGLGRARRRMRVTPARVSGDCWVALAMKLWISGRGRSNLAVAAPAAGAYSGPVHRSAAQHSQACGHARITMSR